MRRVHAARSFGDKELAQLGSGSIVSRDGIILSARRYLDAVASQVDVPLGLGSVTSPPPT
jgi:hypothetical protein